MYLNSCPGCRPSGLSGLSQYEEFFNIGASLMARSASDQDSGGGGGAAPSAQTTTVATDTRVTTQISPQISPIFIQQDQPRDSPVNAGAAMAPVGTIPNTGYLPGFDAASGFLPTGIPSIPSFAPAPAGPSAPLLIAAAAGLLGLIWFARKRKPG